jgi:hypothetical protein
MRELTRWQRIALTAALHCPLSMGARSDYVKLFRLVSPVIEEVPKMPPRGGRMKLGRYLAGMPRHLNS